MYLVAWLPPDWSDAAAARALGEAGVVAVPLSSLVIETKRAPGLMLGYTGHSEAAMTRAIDRIAEIFQRKPV
jgi:DNA-binding transcriptional MocR family regulator